MAVSLAFIHPDRVSKVIVVATGSLLPPLCDGEKRAGAAEGDEGTAAEPTLDESRALLEANLFHRALITPEVLATRHRLSLEKNFAAFRERQRAGRRGTEKGALPLWQRLDEVPVPLLLVYGKDDRGSAAGRAALAKERYPGLNLHVLERCGHLVQWDAAADFVALAADFLAAR
jgi:2-hydroxy-6-oxonona-2,4-dienedioate hydrolase